MKPIVRPSTVLTIPQVESARPDGLTQAGAAMGQSAAGLNERISRQQSTLDTLKSGWQGSASDAAIAKAAPTLQRMRQNPIHRTRCRSTILCSSKKRVQMPLLRKKTFTQSNERPTRPHEQPTLKYSQAPHKWLTKKKLILLASIFQ